MSKTLRKFTEDEEDFLERGLTACLNSKFSNVIGIESCIWSCDEQVRFVPSKPTFGINEVECKYLILHSPKNEELAQELYNRITKITHSPLYKVLNEN